MGRAGRWQAGGGRLQAGGSNVAGMLGEGVLL